MMRITLLLSTLFFVAHAQRTSTAGEAQHGGAGAGLGGNVLGGSGGGEETFYGNLLPYEIPILRFTAFHALSPENQDHAEVLEYTPSTWNLPGTNPIEELAFDGLTPEQQEAAIALGMDEDTWDCYQNHYEDYSWEEMDEWGLLEPVIDLEYYNVSSWNGNTTLPFIDEMEDEYWIEILPEDQMALKQLCYVEQTWDGVIPLLFEPLGQTLHSDRSGNLCDSVPYDGFIGFLHSHMYIVAKPTPNSHMECQFPLVFHDHGGEKAAFEFTIGVETANITEWLPNVNMLHIDTFLLSEISAAFDQAQGFGVANYNMLSNNCYGMALTMASKLGIDVVTNQTMIDFAVSSLAYDDEFMSYVNSYLGKAIFGLDVFGPSISSADFESILKELAPGFLASWTSVTPQVDPVSVVAVQLP